MAKIRTLSPLERRPDEDMFSPFEGLGGMDTLDSERIPGQAPLLAQAGPAPFPAPGGPAGGAPRMAPPAMAQPPAMMAPPAPGMGAPRMGGPEAAPAAGLEPQQKEALYRTLLEKRLAPRDDSKANQANAWSFIGEGLEKIAKAGAAGGVGATETSWQGMRGALADQRSRADQKERQDLETAGMLEGLNREERERFEEEDPESPRSKELQGLAGQLLPGQNFEGKSAKQLRNAIPMLSQAQARKDQLADRASARANAQVIAQSNRGVREDDRQSKADAAMRDRTVPGVGIALNKSSADTIKSSIDRRNNINTNLEILSERVKTYGTGTMFDSLDTENDMINQLVEDIAVDYAKLKDPTSVARPNEVESAKRMLIEPGFWQTEKGVNEKLTGFKRLVEDGYKFKINSNLDPEAPRDEAASDMVMLRSPDGELRQVPAGSVQKYLDRGASLAK